MQYEQFNDGRQRVPLPKPSIDTGMGLERISAILQGVHSNYEIDLFANLIAAEEDLYKVKAQGEQTASFRVIADHLRASSFLIADGVSPSNEGRGYVLRRIMRRAMRHAHILGTREPNMFNLVGALAKEMGEAYPELDPRAGRDRKSPSSRKSRASSARSAAALRCWMKRPRRSARAACWRAMWRSSSTTPSASRST